MSIVKEFKEFISKGNVVDLAVGVIIGASFGKIITSFVDDIIMPFIGYITGGIDFAEKKMVLVSSDSVNQIEEVAVRYGKFINVLIQFFIVAICIFALIKAINALKRKEIEAPEALSVPTKEEVLLTDIRDILKNQKT
jgi:large conductance mechanosensitive channel